MTGISDKACSRKFQLNKISRTAGMNHRFSISFLQSCVHKTIHKKINFIGLCAHNAINPKVDCMALCAHNAIYSNSNTRPENEKGAAGAAPDVRVNTDVTAFQGHPRVAHQQGGCRFESLKYPGAPAPSARQAGHWWPRKGGLQRYAAGHAESGSFQYQPSSATRLSGWQSAAGKDVFLYWKETVGCIVLCFAGIVLSDTFSVICGGRFL